MKDLKSLVILFKAQQSIENQVKVSLKDTDLSVNEFQALEALYSKGALTTQEIIDLILIPNSSMTYVLDTLKKKDYIKRYRDKEDRRVQWVTLTNLGKEHFESVYASHFKHIRPLFDVLDKEEEKMLQEYLKKIGKNAEEKL